MWLAGSTAVAVVAVVVALLATGRATHQQPFVETRGTSFTIGGRPFRFVGFNIYDAAAAGETFYSCDAAGSRFDATQLDATLGYLHDQAGVTVIRFWAYQTYTRSGTDWSGLDEVLALARAHGMRVLPVLEDGPGYCTTGPTGQAKYKVAGDTWYTTGYRHPYGTAALSYRAYVSAVVRHYRNDPTILGWEMMNEATTSLRVGGQPALVGFARDIGSLIHSIDPNHLVTVGTESDGYPGASGPAYRAVYGLPEVDFGVAHDYSGPDQAGSYDPDPMHGLLPDGHLPAVTSSECSVATAPLACSVASSLALHKPVVIDEVGIPAQPGSASQQRARAALLQRKLAAAFDNGVSGELVWNYTAKGAADPGNFNVEEGDAVIPLLHRWNEQLAAG